MSIISDCFSNSCMICWIWGSFNCLWWEVKIHSYNLSLKIESKHTSWHQTYVAGHIFSHSLVHIHHSPCDSLHCLSHGILTLECGDLKGHCLDLGAHHDELLGVPPCSHQVLCHHLHCILRQGRIVMVIIIFVIIPLIMCVSKGGESRKIWDITSNNYNLFFFSLWN